MSEEQRPEPRRAAESTVTMCHLMLPEDANPSWPAVPRRGATAEEVPPPGTGNVHGGTITKLVDTAGGVVATRHARTRVVTARIDTMEFLEPVYVGDLVCLTATVDDVGRTSMEVSVRVVAENLRTGRIAHVSSASLVYVALDEQGRPAAVPPLIAETPEERRRQAAARLRRARRRHQTPPTAGQDGPSPALRWLGAGPRPVVVGHRGAAGLAPENTFASFTRAVDLGAGAVELDVHQTRDGHLVVIHDDTLERTTNGHGRVGDHTLPELQRLDAGSWFGPAFAGERIPALDDVLRWARGRTRLVVEIKAGSYTYPGIEGRCCDLLLAAGMVEQTLAVSFDHEALARVKARLPALACLALTVGVPADPVGLALAAAADGLAPERHGITRDLVEALHDVGMIVLAWTANDGEAVKHLAELGVDAVGTDRPDIAVAARQSLRPPSS